MKRKIIRQGHNTLTITLPSKWAKRFNLEAGREVDLNEKENGLFLSVEKSSGDKKIELDITGLDVPTIWKHFMAIYRQGFTEVKIKFNPDAVMENPFKYFSKHKLDYDYKKKAEKRPAVEILQSFVSRFIGLDIIEHGKDYIIIREMGETTSKEFDNSSRRVIMLVQQMAEEMLNAIKTGDSELLQHAHDMDINIDKFHDYCIRIINRLGIKEPEKAPLYCFTLSLLELIGDEFKHMAYHLHYEKEFKKARLKNAEKMAERVKEQLDIFYQVFYKYDISGINRVSEIDKEIYLSIKDTYKKANEEEKEILHHLRMIERYINALFELRIEMQF